MKSPPRVVVLGATGFTGRLVARELAKHPSIPFLLTGRDAARLSALATEFVGDARGVVSHQPADATDRGSLRDVFRPGDVVINCVGPYERLGMPVVRAAIDSGCHYLDITGEQAFMKRVQENFDRDARAAGVAVVNAMAFEYALGACAASVLVSAPGFEVNDLDIVYSWRMGARSTSTGTRRSIARVLGSGSLSFRDRSWHQERIGARQRAVDLPDGSRRIAVNFPAGEVVTLPRSLDLDSVQGWLVTGSAATSALRILGPLLPAAARLLATALDPLLSRGPSGPDDEVRRASEFAIIVEGFGRMGTAVRVVVTGRDPYGLTAAIVARGAWRCLGRADRTGAPTTEPVEPAPAGVVDPARLMDPAGFLDGLREHGLAWDWAADP